VEVESRSPGVALDSFAESNEDATDGLSGYWPMLTTSEGRVVAAQVRVGAGRFVVLRSTWPATNAGLGREDNALLMVRLLSDHVGAAQPEAGLWFDEFHHGFTNDRSLAAYLRDTSLWVVVGQLAFLLFLVGWRVQRRFGSPLPMYEDELRGSGDYLKAMSQIYRRGGHADHVVAVMLDDLARQLVSHFRLGRGLAGDGLAVQLEEAGHAEAATRLRALRADAERVLARKRVGEKALVRLAQGVAEFIESMRVRRK
jgi:hypothetical protein